MSAIEVPAPARSAARADRHETLRLLVHSKTFLTGATIVGFWLLCAIFQARFLQNPNQLSLDQFAAPSASHWFGTDQNGRDTFARVIAGARDILIIAPAATLLGTVLGTALGLVMGYFRGFVDDSLGRLVDAVLSLPVVIVALLAILSVGQSTRTTILVVGLVFTPLIARTVRSSVLAERELEYVSAAKLRNERAPYILFAEILPNVMEPVIVEFTVRVGYAIFAVATLSFLGFGIPPPSPDWGVQVATHYQYLAGGFDVWPVLFPGLAIASLVIGVSLLADGVAQVFER